MQHSNTLLKLLRLIRDEIELRRVSSRVNVSVVVTKFSCRAQSATSMCSAFFPALFFGYNSYGFIYSQLTHTHTHTAV